MKNTSTRGMASSVMTRAVSQEQDPPHALRLLRVRREQPARRSAAEKRDELAALHSITSSTSC